MMEQPLSFSTEAGQGGNVSSGGKPGEREQLLPLEAPRELGHYRLARLLGRGGFAEVYLGEHRYLGTEVAIKLLQAHLEPEVLQRFCAEARIAARLHHPHIVRIFDFVLLEERGTAFLVMEYAPGGTLRQRHPRGSRLHPATILLYLQQIGAALDYAHHQQCIHCDIKPENMLIGRDGSLLLSDFGIASLSGQNQRDWQQAEAIAGTLAYMAPEQLAGQPQFASDQYALGVVVYEWLCGECPFRGSPAEVLAQHVHAPPPPLRQRVPTLPPGLAAVVERALAKRPEARFATVLEFVRAYEQALGRALRPRVPDRLAQRQVERPTRRALMVGMTSLAASGLLGGGLTWLAFSPQLRPSRPVLPGCPLPLSQPTGRPLEVPAQATPVTPSPQQHEGQGHLPSSSSSLLPRVLPTPRSRSSAPSRL
ncbi:MAG: serine/threonine protein kinase [Thermogemmatispora sp.]|uniref:serine/threonine-protein kinase n=1 Tax=Thermogemmatispora sp. TaxID=1968838 RepID=UPI00261015FB|nr:serine/threonine-protein kinase [Thermogemmatispora sp.]MBX5458536.1 serine/threonine protein kinase [Thermogemmatispora sp.]